MSDIEAVFFDFDGVIVDSVQLKVDAFREMYLAHGSDIADRVEAYQRYHGGMARMQKFRYFEAELLGRPADDARIDALCATYSDLVEEKVTSCPLVPGAVEFLEKWSASIPFYIISGTPEAELQRITERRGLARHFVEVRGSPLGKGEALRHFLSSGGHYPGRTAMIGDAITDYDAAIETGVPFIGVAPAGVPHFFPEGTRTIPDLLSLEAALGLAPGKGDQAPNS